MEGLVPVQEGLDAVSPGGNVRQAGHRVSLGGRPDDRILAGLQPLDVDPEDLLGLRAVVDLEPGLIAGVLREHHQEPAVDRRFSRSGPNLTRIWNPGRFDPSAGSALAMFSTPA